MPRHINPTSPKRTATAPYNFVPLPELVFSVADGIEVNGKRIKPWQMHDRFLPGTHSGWVDLTIETLTPLFIRGAVRQRGHGTWDEREARLRSEPQQRPDGTPVIPGSSLRGMSRTLLEILSFSKVDPITDAKPFFRTFGSDRIGRAYRTRMVRSGQKPSGGILVIEDGAVRILRRQVVRVSRQVLQQQGLRIGSGSNYTPPWPQQHGPCWVKVPDNSDTVSQIVLGADRPQDSDWRRGTLVLTGNSGNSKSKRREFVFLDVEGSTPEGVAVPQGIWERFHDEDQITQWQERAFPRNQPPGAKRRAPGHLRNGEPVFFLTDGAAESEENRDGLVFLGRAGMFRLPYDWSPADLIPQVLRDVPLDLAEAMFGKVEPGDAIKGRLRFEDAVAIEGGPDWFESLLVPQILSSPKPTTFQHYLTQDGAKGKDQLTTYLEGDYTAIRGHKAYWHRWDEGSGISQVQENNDHDTLKDLQSQAPTDTQHTIIRPVKAGVKFRGRVRFENLTDIELGALLEALQLPDDCCHRLGMGKPLGLGSVRITTRVRIIDRSKLYRTWQGGGVQENEDGRRCRDGFVNAMLDHARSSGETLINGSDGLRQIARLDALYRILNWSNRPNRDRTTYMVLKQFRDRLVLPTPHAVVGAAEPDWPLDPPRPASAASGAAVGLAPARQAEQDSVTRFASAGPGRTIKPVNKGQTRPGVLRRRADTMVAVFEGDEREATIVNLGAIPADCSDGSAAEFYITEQSKQGGIKARFERMTRS